MKKYFLIGYVSILVLGGMMIAGHIMAAEVDNSNYGVPDSTVDCSQISNPNPLCDPVIIYFSNEIPGCDTRTDGFSTLTGESCLTNIPYGGNVLGAEKFIFTLSLKMGSRGNEVMELQKFLNKHNYSVSSRDLGSLDNETIYFGSKTKAALIKFQLANGLVGDGIVGPFTRTVLNK